MELKNQPIYKGAHKRSVLIFGRAQPFFPKIMYISLLDRNDIFQWVFFFQFEAMSHEVRILNNSPVE